MPEDAGLLSLWLSEKKGGRVTITVPERGLRKSFWRCRRKCEGALPERQRCRSKSGAPGGCGKTAFSERTKVIGAIDISNTGGEEAVGAFVYWEDGGFKKQRYRHIKMDAVSGPDDYAMMKEMVQRTIRNLKKNCRI